MFNGARPGDECDRPPTLGASGVSAFGRLRSTPTRPNGLASVAGAPFAPAERGSIERLVAKGEIATAIAVRAAVRLMTSANLLCVGHIGLRMIFEALPPQSNTVLDEFASGQTGLPKLLFIEWTLASHSQQELVRAIYTRCE